MGDDDLAESLKVLEGFYVESWMPDWAAKSEQNVIHVEVDPARPLPEGVVLK